MNKVEQLINELCPNGVEYKTFGEIATIVRGASPRPINNFITDSPDGVHWIKIGDISVGDKHVKTTKEKITKEGAKKSRFVKKGDFILSNSMSFGRPYILAIDGCIHDGWLSISKFSNYFISDFLYHLLSSHNFQQEMAKKASFGGAVQNLNADIVKSLVLPLPPLPIQCEIVRILDNFTELTAELTVELTAELTARKKQYDYYRDSLLTFSDEVKWKQLEESIISLTTGLNPRQFFILNSDDAQNYYVTIREIQNNTVVFTDRTDRIDDDALRLCNNRSNLEEGDVLFSGTGTIGETAVVNETPTNWNIKEGVYSIKPNQEKILSRFLMHLLQSKEIRSNYLSKAAGGIVKSVPMKEMRKLKVPDVPVPEQQSIVEILDRFDTLCNDISEGLSAEIKARQQQYEYYRDKLLTFKEKEACVNE